MLEKTLPIDMRNDRAWIVEKDSLERFKETRNYWLVEERSTPFNYIHKLLDAGTSSPYLRAWHVRHSILVSCSQALASLGSLATKVLDALADVLAFLAATI